MSDNEREQMINKLNNVKKKPKLLETFFNLNGREATENELNTFQHNIELEFDDSENNNIVNNSITHARDTINSDNETSGNNDTDNQDSERTEETMQFNNTTTEI